MDFLYQIYFGIVFFIIGACFGSFFRCMADRNISGDKFDFFTRSHCDCCGHKLRFIDLIPVISFLLLKGKCRYCHEKIATRTIISELLFGVICLLMFLKFDISFELLKGLIIISCLFPAALIDLDTMMVPNIFFIVLGLIWVCIVPFEENKSSYLISSLLGGILVPLIILIISKLMWLLKHKDGIGGGDIKLMFSIGLFLGIEKSILNTIIMCLIGLLIAAYYKKRTGERFAFVPAIFISTCITWLYGAEVLKGYFSLLGLEVSVI